jgi:YD repeat-containing protein
MKHNRKLGLCFASLTTARVSRHAYLAMTEVRDEIEQVVIACDFVKNAPFTWITLSLRLGLKNEDAPHYAPINEEHQDLPLAIEVDMRELQHADRGELRRLFGIAALKALVHAGAKYGLPWQELNQLLELKQAASAGGEGNAVGGLWYDSATEFDCTYDAWNRLVSATDGTTTVAFQYDGTGRRTERIVGSTAEHFYYSGEQVIETRLPDGNGDLQPEHQYVWSLRYIDSPIPPDGQPRPPSCSVV